MIIREPVLDLEPQLGSQVTLIRQYQLENKPLILVLPGLFIVPVCTNVDH